MELRHLRYFVAVAEAGNLTRAARSLGIQQPPLSHQIQQLERELGYPLFRRLPRGVELTAGGQAFRDDAERILAQVRHAAERGARATLGMTGSLSIGFTSSAGLHRSTPDLIRRFRESHPDVDLEIQEGNAAVLTLRVATGRLDVAFLRRPVAQQSGLTYHRLAVEPLIVALPASHRLAAKGARTSQPPVRLRDLAGEPFIFVSRTGAAGMYGDLVEACRKAGFAPKVAAEVNQMLTNITLVAAGVGISVVPASMRGIHDDTVRYAELRPAAGLNAPLTLMTRLDDPNPAVARFLRFALSPAEGARAAPSPPASAARRAAASPPPKPPGRGRARRS